VFENAQFFVVVYAIALCYKESSTGRQAMSFKRITVFDLDETIIDSKHRTRHP